MFAQDQLGGQNEDLLGDRMKVISKEVNEEKIKNEKSRKLMDNKNKANSMAIEELKNEYKKEVSL